MAVTFITDSDGNKSEVLLSYQEYQDLIDEIEELKLIIDRDDEESIAHNEVSSLIFELND